MESAIVFICSAFCLGFDFQQSQLLCLHSVRTQTVPNQTQSQFPVFYSPYRMIDAGLIDVDTGKNTQIAVSGWWNPIRIHKKKPHQNGAGCPFAESQMGSTVAW
jgi:hypothetical protein